MKNLKRLVKIIENTRREKEGGLWELFHENSKVEKHKIAVIPQHIVAQKMQEDLDTLDYQSFPMVNLLDFNRDKTLDLVSCITNRKSARDWTFSSMDLSELSMLLQLSYGLNRSNEGTSYARSFFRNCPSGGALYPLEIYISARNIDGLKPGLYHFNPYKKALEYLREGDQTFNFSKAFMQRDIIENAACIWMISAIFRRSTFKYFNRGYRFVFLEAGHLAQNANLVATGLGLNVLNIGGYFDREIDDYLEFNGIDQSVIYCLAFGRPVTIETNNTNV